MKPFNKNISSANQVVYRLFLVLDHLLGRRLAFALTRWLRKWYYEGLHRQLKKGPKGQLFEVERRSDITIEEFKKEYLKKRLPFILEGAAAEWASVKKWSLEYLKAEHGSDEIVLVNQQDVENGHEELTLSELIDGINDGLARYYRFYPLIQRHPERLHDFDYKWMQKLRQKRVVFDAFQVFIGPDKSYTPLHNANAGNLFTQVYGEKEWRLYPNHYMPVMDPGPVQSNYRTAPIRKGHGPFNPFEADYSTPYHLFEYLDSYSAKLKPGDVLFNPPYWWHAVENTGHTIGVGYRWLSLFPNFRSFPLLSLLDMCATRPPFWKTWALTKKDSNLTHLAEVGKLKPYLKQKRK